MKGKQVKQNEEPVKTIQYHKQNNQSFVKLYGIWQTQNLENKLNEDGSLPSNKYGNYEIFAGELPEGTVHIELPVSKLCKQHGIQHVDAVIGFERNKQFGRSHAVKNGVVAFKKDEKKINELYEVYKVEIMESEKQKCMKDILGKWKKIFNAILIRKNINEKYGHM